MRSARLWRWTCGASVIILTASFAVAESPKEPRRSVVASVEVASGQGPYVQAEKRPGEFTIPKGFLAVDLKYAYHDPKSDFQTDKLRPSNIYSVTQKRYYPAVTNDSESGLPPGEYKLAVGGQPGATGVLSYRLKPMGDDFKPVAVDGPKSAGPNGPSDFDVPLTEVKGPDGLEKTSEGALFRFRGTTVTAEHTVEMSSDAKSLSRSLLQVQGTYSGGRLTATGTMIFTMRHLEKRIDYCETRFDGVLSGQADANGRMVVRCEWRNPKVRVRDAVGNLSVENQWHYGEWKDAPADMPYVRILKPFTLEGVLQLPKRKSPPKSGTHAPPQGDPTTRDTGKTTDGDKPTDGGIAKPPTETSTPGGGGGVVGGSTGLPRDFDIVYNEGPFKEHPVVFRFRGEAFTAQSQFEMSYPIKEGGKSVYTYQTEIVGTFRQGKAEGTYTYYGTGGHFGSGMYSVGLYYKAWIWGPVAGQARGGQLALTVNMNHHKHIDRIIPAKPEWGPWKDNTALMEDASRVASPWRPSTLQINLKLPVGQSQESQKLAPPETFKPIPSPE